MRGNAQCCDRSSSSHRRALAIIIAAALCGFAGAAHAQPSFTPVGDLPGGQGSYAQGISADGSTVVGWDYYNNNGLLYNHAFVWSAATGIQPVFAGELDFTSAAYAVSPDGLFIGGFHALTIIEEKAFVWSAAGGEQAFDTRSVVYGLSNNGLVAAGALGNRFGGYEPVAWINGHRTSLDSQNVTTGVGKAYAVTPDGSVIVGAAAFTASQGLRAFRWTAATGVVNLGSPVFGGPSSNAFAVSPDGAFVVGAADSGNGTVAQAFRWTSAGGMQILGTLTPGGSSVAYGVSADGQTVVGDAATPSGQRAFIWRPQTGMQDLGTALGGALPAGWTLTGANAITPNGLTIVGTGYPPAPASTQAWIAKLPSCGSADFNCDGNTGTDQDIEAFFACLAGTCPPLPCTNSADFNADGNIGTDADIESFFRVLAGGPC